MNAQFSAINCNGLPEKNWTFSLEYFWLDDKYYRARMHRTHSPNLIYVRDLNIESGWVGENWILYKLTTI